MGVNGTSNGVGGGPAGALSPIPVSLHNTESRPGLRWLSDYVMMAYTAWPQRSTTWPHGLRELSRGGLESEAWRILILNGETPLRRVVVIYRVLGLLAVLLLSAASCVPKQGVARPFELDAWAVYYDADRGLAELREHGALFDRVSLFAYELDSDGTPTPAPNMEGMIVPFLRLAAEKRFEPWVTVVNDVRYGLDSVVAKDSAVIRGLIVDPVRRSAHARDLAARVSGDGFHGLHLDYERVPESYTRHYHDFVRDLSEELQQRGLGLELVIEPVNGPLQVLSDARVTVMAYDLFGTHSGPGPRSTPTFVSQLGSRADLDSDSAAAVAIAVGGFAWDPDGDVRPLDWSAGHQLAAHAPSQARSRVDQVPNARLGDGTEIWLEDVESLVSKWEAAWTVGFRRLAIWRLGGNDSTLFDMIRELRQGSDSR